MCGRAVLASPPASTALWFSLRHSLILTPHHDHPESLCILCSPYGAPSQRPLKPSGSCPTTSRTSDVSTPVSTLLSAVLP